MDGTWALVTATDTPREPCGACGCVGGRSAEGPRWGESAGRGQSFWVFLRRCRGRCGPGWEVSGAGEVGAEPAGPTLAWGALPSCRMGHWRWGALSVPEPSAAGGRFELHSRGTPSPSLYERTPRRPAAAAQEAPGKGQSASVRTFPNSAGAARLAFGEGHRRPR